MANKDYKSKSLTISSHKVSKTIATLSKIFIEYNTKEVGI